MPGMGRCRVAPGQHLGDAFEVRSPERYGMRTPIETPELLGLGGGWLELTTMAGSAGDPVARSQMQHMSPNRQSLHKLTVRRTTELLLRWSTWGVRVCHRSESPRVARVTAPAGSKDDPEHPHQWRYWDGTRGARAAPRRNRHHHRWLETINRICRSGSPARLTTIRSCVCSTRSIISENFDFTWASGKVADMTSIVVTLIVGC